MRGYVMNGNWKVDKQPSGQLPSDFPKPGRRSPMNDPGWYTKGRERKPAHWMSPWAWRNNFRPKTVSLKDWYTGVRYSVPVLISEPKLSEFKEVTKEVFKPNRKRKEVTV